MITHDRFAALEAIADLLMWAGFDVAADVIYARVEAEIDDQALDAA